GSPGFANQTKAAEAAVAKETGENNTGQKAAPASPTPAKPAPTAVAEEPEAPVVPPPERPLLTLDAKSFTRRRDPFVGFSPTELVVAEPDRPRAKRPVEMPQYAFE